MTGLREMFEDLADGAPPSSQLIGDDLYVAGRQRHRRRTRLAAGAAALALAVLAGGTGAVLTRGGPEPPGPAAAAQTLPAGSIAWFGAADANHLYVAQLACASGCPKTRLRLLGSDDGGRTWTERASAVDIGALTVLGPRTLVVSPPGDSKAPMVSTDGGRVWTPAQRHAAVATVPAGGGLICWSATGETGCTAHVVDPAGGWFAPLATPPALAAGYTVESVAGRLWAAGTTPAGEPAVAVSTDAGGSWARQSFDCDCERPALATTADGRTGYALLADSHREARYAYRVGLTGDPDKIDGVDTTGDAGTEPFVTTDGTLVVYEVVRTRGDLDGLRFWGARHGGPFQLIELAGLPSTVQPIQRAADGWFYTYSYGSDRGFYGSPDGRRWTLITRVGD